MAGTYTFKVNSSKNKLNITFEVQPMIKIVDARCDLEGLTNDNRVRLSYEAHATLRSKLQIGDEIGWLEYGVKLTAFHTLKDVEFGKQFSITNPRVDKFEVKLVKSSFEDVEDLFELVDGGEDCLVNDTLESLYDHGLFNILISEVQ